MLVPLGSPCEPSLRLLLTLVGVLVCVCSFTATLAFNAGYQFGTLRAGPAVAKVGWRSRGSNADRLSMLVEVQRDQRGLPAVLPAHLQPRVLERHGAERLSEGWPCKEKDRLFMDLCYVDCSVATEGKFPHRDDPCSCCQSSPCEKAIGAYAEDCLRLDKGADGKEPQRPELVNCRDETEELFDGLCYLKCEILTAKMYPARTGMNTCSNDMFGGNWIMGIGPCSGFGVGSSECMPHIPMPVGLGVPADEPVETVDVGVPPIGLRVLPAFPNLGILGGAK